MAELGYKKKAIEQPDRRKVRQKYVLHGKRFYSADAYYGAVYEDIVEYKQIDSSKIKSNADLRKFLQGDPKISEKLVSKLENSSYHQELLNINLGREGHRLKNGRMVRVEKTERHGVEVRYYRDMLVIAKRQRTFYRDVDSGRFIRLR